MATANATETANDVKKEFEESVDKLKQSQSSPSGSASVQTATQHKNNEPKGTFFRVLFFVVKVLFRFNFLNKNRIQ